MTKKNFLLIYEIAPHHAVSFDTHTQSFFGEAKETKPFEERYPSAAELTPLQRHNGTLESASSLSF